MPDDLDQRRVKLDQRRLDFEIRQYDDAKALRELTEKKLRAKLAESERPFFTKPAYLTPVATIIVAIVGGVIAFGTDIFKSDVVKLSKQRAALTQQVDTLTKSDAKLKGQANELVQQNRTLTTQQDILFTKNKALDQRSRDLAARNGMLQHNQVVLHDQNQGLLTKQQELSQEIDASQAKIQQLVQNNAKLTQQLPEEQLAALLNLLRKGVAPLSPTDPLMQSIIGVSRGISGTGPVGKLTNLHNEEDAKLYVKVECSYILVQLTGNQLWKDSLARDALAIFSDAAKNGSWLYAGFYSPYIDNAGIYSKDERVSLLRKVYEIQKSIPITNSVVRPFYTTSALFLKDTEVMTAFRDPWIDNLRDLYNAIDKGSFNSLSLVAEGLELGQFCSQAYALKAIRQIAGGPVPPMKQYDVLVIPPGDVKECPYPANVPLCKDFVQGQPQGSKLVYSRPLFSEFQVYPARRKAYQDWERDNKSMMDMWLGQDTFSGLSSLPDTQFEMILKNQWIKTN